MEKYFVTYAQSIALKKLGFDMPCFTYVYIGDTGNNVDRYEEVEPSRAINFNHDSLCVSQPLKSQVFEWGRREYGLHHVVHHFQHNRGTSKEFLSEVSGKLLMGNDDIDGFSYHSTYDKAESACIDKLIEIVENNLDK